MFRDPVVDSLEAQMQVLLSTAREMIELARQGNFSRVAELDQRRNRELAACLSGPVNQAETEVLRRGMTRMVELHAVLVEVVSQARGQVLGQVTVVRRSQRAIDSYSATTL